MIEIGWEPGKTPEESAPITIIAPLCEMCEAPATKEHHGGLDWHPICDECSEWFAPNIIRTPEYHDANIQTITQEA